jgi:peptide/nickel transport system substrate-binding protein
MKKMLFVFVALMMLLAACAPAATQAPVEPVKPAATEAPAKPAATEAPKPTEAPTVDPNMPVMGGTVIVGTSQEPSNLNPVLASATIDDVIGSFFAEGLVGFDVNGAYVPVLAEALPEVSADGLKLTYKIKPGLKYSNGDPVVCADVQFTKDVITSDLSGASTSGYSDIASIECPDDLTVVVNMEAVFAPYLNMFSYLIPRSAGAIADLEKWEYNRAPIGTGPWIVQEWQAGDHITLVKNPNYREAGKPYLDSVIIKILPSREVGIQLLGTGEITTLWDLTEADFPTLAKMDGVTYAGGYYGSGENELLLFNLADPKVDAPADAAAAPHPILSDLKVREAIQYAIDKKSIVDTLLYGNVKPVSTVLPTGTFACPQPATEFNLDKAKSMLDEAGWKPGADGIREKGGVRMSLKISTTTGNQLREQTEQVLAEMFKAAGIDLVIDNVPSDVLFAGWDADGMRKHGKFDILLYTTGAGNDPDSHMFGNYHTLRIPVKDNDGAGNNFSRYSNPDVDKLIDDASATTDIAARKGMYCKIATQINKDLPRVFLYERLIINGYRTNLQNFQVSSSYLDFTVDSQNWWLKP